MTGTSIYEGLLSQPYIIVSLLLANAIGQMGSTGDQSIKDYYSRALVTGLQFIKEHSRVVRKTLSVNQRSI